MNGGASVLIGRGCQRIAQVAIGTAIFAATAFGADDDKVIFPSGGTQVPPPSTTSAATLNTVTLLIALVLAGIGAWLYWKNRRAPGIRRDGRLLAIEESRSLGNRQYLVVASYEDKKFLLGVCPGRIDLLSPLHDSERAEDNLP
jgi:flagellar protein FliO/FliZ